MNNIMEFMSQDHDRLDDLFKEFQKIKNQNLEKAKTLYAEFESGLRRHIIWEEEILFPAFEEQTGMKNLGPTAVMRMEHHQIKEFLGQISHQLEQQKSGTFNAEENLIQVLASHNQKEEKILYPWIDRTLSDDERLKMIARMQNRPSR